MNKDKSRAFTLALVGLLLCFLCALFPPRRSVTGGPTSVSRAFLFDADIDKNKIKNSDGFTYSSVEIDAGRLLAEFILIVAATGFGVIYSFAPKAKG